MTKPIARDPIYRKRAFDADVIELGVHWYITLAGIELAHHIRKGQSSFGRGRRRRSWSRKDEWALALAAEISRDVPEPINPGCAESANNSVSPMAPAP